MPFFNVNKSDRHLYLVRNGVSIIVSGFALPNAVIDEEQCALSTEIGKCCYQGDQFHT